MKRTAKPRLRNYVAKNVNVVRCATHTDKKKAQKHGYSKHKGSTIDA